MLGEHTLKEESPFSPSRVKYGCYSSLCMHYLCSPIKPFHANFLQFRVEEMHKGGPPGRLLSALNSGEL